MAAWDEGHEEDRVIEGVKPSRGRLADRNPNRNRDRNRERVGGGDRFPERPRFRDWKIMKSIEPPRRRDRQGFSRGGRAKIGEEGECSLLLANSATWRLKNPPG